MQELGDKARPKGLLRKRLKGKILPSVLAGVGHSELGSICVEALRPWTFMEVVG